jgi:hypothetical protein
MIAGNLPSANDNVNQGQQANNLFLQQKKGGPPSSNEDSPPQANALQ